jgi:hypothetical protein
VAPDVGILAKLPTRGDWQLPQSNPKWRSPTLAREQTEMIPAAHIEHQLPGRARLRVPSKRGEVPFFEKVVRELSKHPAVHELTATPLTGSIMLQYVEPLRAITAAAYDQNLFKTGRPQPIPRRGEPNSAGRVSNASVLTNGLATGLSGLSLFQAAQGNVLGSAVESFWHAFGAHRILGRPNIAAAFAALGVYQMLRGQLFGPASSLVFYALVMRQIAAIEQARGHSWGTPAAQTAKSAGGTDANGEAAARTAGSLLDKATGKLSR